MNHIDTAEILKSLADDTRLALIRKLAKENHEVSSSTLINGCGEVLKLTQPTLSHHLGRLVRSGVLKDRKIGTEKFYCLDTELLASIGIDPTKL